MEPEYWHDKWSNNEIGFHQAAPNRHLTRHIDCLALSTGDRIFLPLCGRAPEIDWLRQRGLHVLGVELEELAIRQLFAELQEDPLITQHGNLTRFSSDGLDLFVGDIFDLSADLLGQIDAVYDRAALVALPWAMRQRYSRCLQKLTDHAQQLVVTFIYDQYKMDGPPFSIDLDELQQHYAEHFSIQTL